MELSSGLIQQENPKNYYSNKYSTEVVTEKDDLKIWND